MLEEIMMIFGKLFDFFGFLGEIFLLLCNNWQQYVFFKVA
jgi:hypothetical protein